MKLNITAKNWEDREFPNIRIDSLDVRNLDITLAVIILPCLEKFKTSDIGHPTTMSKKKWHLILDDMITAFYILMDEGFKDLPDSLAREERDQIVKKGLKLFSKYFEDLWF